MILSSPVYGSIKVASDGFGENFKYCSHVTVYQLQPSITRVQELFHLYTDVFKNGTLYRYYWQNDNKILHFLEGNLCISTIINA